MDRIAATYRAQFSVNSLGRMNPARMPEKGAYRSASRSRCSGDRTRTNTGGRKKVWSSAAAAMRPRVVSSSASASGTASARTVSSRQKAREKGVGNRCATRASAMEVWALAGQYSRAPTS